jgi:hypothetical protein
MEVVYSFETLVITYQRIEDITSLVFFEHRGNMILV